ncbi:nucleoside hydrolase [Pelomyxa schiedti]|nr:nucleoside hydrolase [Pelomyxa schiedti]
MAASVGLSSVRDPVGDDKIHVIIDSDMGVDDALAALCTLTCNNCSVDAITIVCGNTPVANGVVNAARLLELVNKPDIPIFAGADSPLLPTFKYTSWPGHGRDGVGNAADQLTTPSITARKEIAASAIVQMVNTNPHKYHLLCLGPLTNIAIAMSLDPTLPSKLTGITLMGGSHLAKGNTSYSAEFNIYVDAEAASIVFSHCALSGTYLTMVSWEQTIAMTLTWKEFDTLVKSGPSPFSKYIGKICAVYEGMSRPNSEHRTSPDVPEWVMCDSVAAAVLLIPASVTNALKMHGQVETGTGLCRGTTVFDWSQKTAPNVRIVTQMDRALYLKMVQLCLSGNPWSLTDL